MNSSQFAGGNVDALAARASADRSPDAAINELFVTILARRPTKVELEMVRDELQDGARLPEERYRELAWALLLSSEFSLNH